MRHVERFLNLKSFTVLSSSRVCLRSCSAHAEAAGVVSVLLIQIDCCISPVQCGYFLSRCFKLTLSGYSDGDILNITNLFFMYCRLYQLKRIE